MYPYAYSPRIWYGMRHDHNIYYHVAVLRHCHYSTEFRKASIYVLHSA